MKGGIPVSLKQHHDALLDGLHPIFPESIKIINQICGNREVIRGIEFEKVSQTIDGFLKIIRPTTSDDYCWFWGLVFNIQNEEVIITFPWAQDWDKKDGIQLDRSIAVYIKKPWFQILVFKFKNKLHIKQSTIILTNENKINQLISELAIGFQKPK
ncbi:MAG: hypothetical protein WCT51_00290 [Candidatus Shapirobacteria bacterium]